MADEEKQEKKRDLGLMKIMKSGDCVILMDRSRHYQHITIGSKMTQRINRTRNIDLSILRNKPYGSVFELVGSELIERAASSWRSLREETNLDNNHNEIRDNEELFHDPTNQQLTQTEILKMKSNCQKSADTNTLINKIAESSKTFHLKTEFSKEKYLKSKKAKHSSLLITLVCNASNICEMYFNRKPDKTMGMRIDTLSQILSLANIHHNQYVLCIESCTGLVTASAAQRMNGVGKIFNIYCGKNPIMDIANNMFYNVNKDNEIIYNVNIGVFNDPLWINDNEENDEKLKQIIDSNSKLSKCKESRPSLYDIKQWIKFEKSDCLILCSKYYPVILFKHLYEYLDYGCPFVVWCEYIQPLIQIKQWFMRENMNEIEAVGLRIHENWFREQQVLPQRTHPMVNMQHLGGYILSGIKVRPRPSIITIINQNNDIKDDIDSVSESDHEPSLKRRKLS